MRFGEQFEFHKIPEFYNMYLNYEILKNDIELFKMKLQNNELCQLPGYYIRLKNTRTILRLISDEKFDGQRMASRIEEQIEGAQIRDIVLNEMKQDEAAERVSGDKFDLEKALGVKRSNTAREGISSAIKMQLMVNKSQELNDNDMDSLCRVSNDTPEERRENGASLYEGGQGEAIQSETVQTQVMLTQAELLGHEEEKLELEDSDSLSQDNEDNTATLHSIRTSQKMVLDPKEQSELMPIDEVDEKTPHQSIGKTNSRFKQNYQFSQAHLAVEEVQEEDAGKESSSKRSRNLNADPPFFTEEKQAPDLQLGSSEERKSAEVNSQISKRTELTKRTNNSRNGIHPPDLVKRDVWMTQHNVCEAQKDISPALRVRPTRSMSLASKKQMQSIINMVKFNLKRKTSNSKLAGDPSPAKPISEENFGERALQVVSRHSNPKPQPDPETPSKLFSLSKRAKRARLMKQPARKTSERFETPKQAYSPPAYMREDLEFFKAVHREVRVRVQKVIHLNMEFITDSVESFYRQCTSFHNTSKKKGSSKTLQHVASASQKIYNHRSEQVLDKQLIEMLMPFQFGKKEVTRLKNQQREYSISEKQKIHLSEQYMIKWINRFIQETNAIEDFYVDKVYSSIIQFIELQAQFISKNIIGYNQEPLFVKSEEKRKKKRSPKIDLEACNEKSEKAQRSLRNLLCPITANIIRLDQTGSVDRASITAIKQELDMIDFSDMNNYKIRYEERSRAAGAQAKQGSFSRLSSFVKQYFGEDYPRKRGGKDQEIGKADEDDEIEFATNWIRAFQKIYMELKWLNAFAIINQIAIQKIFKKFMKVHFQMTDNVLDKNIQVKIQSYEFIKRSNLQGFIKDFKFVIADYFTDGNLSRAKKLMEGDNNRMNRRDLCFTAFFGGSVSVFFLTLIILLLIWRDEDTPLRQQLIGIQAANPIFRLTFAFCYILFATGICIYVFRKKEINYLHIFELDYNFKVQQNQLWRLTSILFFLWTIAFGLEFLIFFGHNAADLEEPAEAGYDWVSLGLFLTFMVICLQPCCGCFYRTARFELGKVIFQIFKAPFGTVRFRDFFFADIITSMGTTLADIAFTVEYFRQKNWHSRSLELESEAFLTPWKSVMLFLPFWFRMWQCIHKFYFQGNRMQLVNALKYVSKFGPATAIVAGCSKRLLDEQGEVLASYWVYFFFQIVTTVFCMYWDFRWDWGLFIGTEPGTRFLRNETKFAPSFYYTCMLLNFIFRFWWLISMFLIEWTGTEHTLLEQLELYTFVSMMVEGVRRTFWSIIRVENEFFNNFEQYRDTILIPPIKED